MAVENKTTIILPDGRAVEALKPVIVSASRSTDIPAFYPDWFFKRLEIGYSVWTNPFNGIRSYISYEDTRFIVFWSKNPRPLLSYLDRLDERGIGCYIQYTVNDYEKEGLVSMNYWSGCKGLVMHCRAIPVNWYSVLQICPAMPGL